LWEVMGCCRVQEIGDLAKRATARAAVVFMILRSAEANTGAEWGHDVKNLLLMGSSYSLEKLLFGTQRLAEPPTWS
jgi:hypothetical protein